MGQWRLEVRFADSVEEAGFPSRAEALECARSILADYETLEEVDVFSPSGKGENIQREQLFPASEEH